MKKNNSLIILAIVVVLVVGVVLSSKSNKTSITPPVSQSNTTVGSKEQTRTFQSTSTMKFAITVPVIYEIVEKFGSASINTGKGTISIGQNGTNFNNLKEYIKNSRNNLEARIVNRKELRINGLEAVSGNIGSEKTYFIYVENRVYSLSTSSPVLFPDLDQIAQSFRYTP